MVLTLPAINIGELLKALEDEANVKLPKKVIDISLAEGVLHIRFDYPETQEAEVVPLPLKTPSFLFRDERTGEITALEILDIEQVLAELGQPMKAVKRDSSIAQPHWSAVSVTYVMMLQKYTSHEGIDDVVEREHPTLGNVLRKYQVELLVKPPKQLVEQLTD